LFGEDNISSSSKESGEPHASLRSSVEDLTERRRRALDARAWATEELMMPPSNTIASNAATAKPVQLAE
jgi:hypothetical protein